MTPGTKPRAKSVMTTSEIRESITLRALLSTLDTSVAELLDAPEGGEVTVSSVALIESSDLSIEIESQSPMPDLCLHVGVRNAEAVRWFHQIAHLPHEHRPRAVMSKTAAKPGPVHAAARQAGVALVAVHTKVRWDHLLPLIQRMLDRSRGQQSTLDGPDLLASGSDLFDLAQIVARNTGGMVSIEDARSHVLAYSASDASADELRTLSILGREGPRDYLNALNKLGVFERLRGSDEVIDVPADRKLGTKRRLVVSIRESARDSTPTQRMLGSIWVQQGAGPLTADAAAVLRGGAAIAARIISRTLNAPSAEGVLIQRLFGARSGGIDIPSVSTALNLHATGPAAVIGFATAVSGDSMQVQVSTGIGSMLRLQASSFRRDSVSTIIGDRAYVLLPEYKSAKAVSVWTRQLIDRFETKQAIMLRAAISLPVADLGRVAGARTEVDRVLDRTASAFPKERVTTLAESRTTVLLGEILDLVEERPELQDPRLEALYEYDRKHDSNLRESAEIYLDRYGDVRTAATLLQVHPNTLRYRIRRVEEIVGVDIRNASDRLLLDLQLTLHKRR